MAESSVPAELEEARRTIGQVAGELNRVIDELREISCGIHPAILSEAGLGPALRTLARRSAISVELSGAIEASARDGSLRLSIRDDGVGGADPAGGSGLVGLRDRVEAWGGSIEITSPPGHGTHLVVQFPLKLDLTVDSPLARQSRAGSVAASPRQRGRGRSRT